MIVNALLWAADVVLAAVHVVFLAATVYLAPPRPLQIDLSTGLDPAHPYAE